MDFLNSKIGRRFSYSPQFITETQHILGEMVPVRAQTGYDEEAEEEIDGSATVLTEVIDWPFSEDEEGIEFDQENLYGVRTVCWRRPLGDGGGDKDYWTAVPKSLPSGYTAVRRCGLTLSPLYSDHLSGTDASAGAAWNHRTASGLLLDTTDPTGAARSLWTPRNLNQEVLRPSLSSAFPQYTEPDQDIPYAYRLTSLAFDHVGFRGGEIGVTVLNPGIGAYSGSESYDICFLRSDQPWEQYTEKPAEIEVLDSFTINYSFASAGSPNQNFTFNFGDLKPSSIGYVGYFFLLQEPYADLFPPAGASYSRPNMIFDAFFSPRTDVPLWYFASMRNRCAPGGIVIP